MTVSKLIWVSQSHNPVRREIKGHNAHFSYYKYKYTQFLYTLNIKHDNFNLPKTWLSTTAIVTVLPNATYSRKNQPYQFTFPWRLTTGFTYIKNPFKIKYLSEVVVNALADIYAK